MPVSAADINIPLEALLDRTAYLKAKQLLLVPDIQRFTANGLWTKPDDAVEVMVLLVGCGHTGGPGGQATSTGGGSGGAGGCSGGFFQATWQASDLPATVSVAVGTTAGNQTVLTDPTSSGILGRTGPGSPGTGSGAANAGTGTVAGGVDLGYAAYNSNKHLGGSANIALGGGGGASGAATLNGADGATGGDAMGPGGAGGAGGVQSGSAVNPVAQGGVGGLGYGAGGGGGAGGHGGIGGSYGGGGGGGGGAGGYGLQDFALSGQDASPGGGPGANGNGGAGAPGIAIFVTWRSVP